MIQGMGKEENEEHFPRIFIRWRSHFWPRVEVALWRQRTSPPSDHAVNWDLCDDLIESYVYRIHKIWKYDIAIAKRLTIRRKVGPPNKEEVRRWEVAVCGIETNHFSPLYIYRHFFELF